MACEIIIIQIYANFISQYKTPISADGFQSCVKMDDIWICENIKGFSLETTS